MGRVRSASAVRPLASFFIFRRWAHGKTRLVRGPILRPPSSPPPPPLIREGESIFVTEGKIWAVLGGDDFFWGGAKCSNL